MKRAADELLHEGTQKRLKPTDALSEEAEGMEVDEEDHPLAPIFGNVSRDGNEWAVQTDPNAYAVPPCSPESASDQTMESEEQTGPWASYTLGGHYGSHPLSHQLSVDTLSSFESSAGPATPAEEHVEELDYDETFPCYAWGKDSAGVSRPFSLAVGPGHA